MKKAITLSLLFASIISWAQTFNGATGLINNNGTSTYFNIPVSGLYPGPIDSLFGLEKVCLDITHPATEELHIYLKSPQGTMAELSLPTSISGANYTNTCFNSQSSQSITLASAPFTGTFRPTGYLGRFNTGQSGNGTWQLIIKDFRAFINAGSLNYCSITFGFTPAAPVQFTSSNLPIVVINSNNQPIGTLPVLVNMGIIYNGQNRNYLTDPFNHYNNKAKIKIRGNSSQTFEKKQYHFETADQSGAELDAPLLGMPEEHDWTLIANYSDKTLLRNQLAYYIFGQMGHYSPRYRQVEVVLNNEYLGVYGLVEKIKRDSGRVDIAKMTTTDNYYPDVTGGYILKIDRPDAMGWYSLFPGNSQAGNYFYYQYSYPKDSNITIPQKNYIKAFMDTFETVMNGPNFADPQTGYPKYIDVQSFVDYFLVNELTKNVDGYRLSTYLYKDKSTAGGKLHIGPVWDYDLAWHNCNYGNSNSASGWEYLMPNDEYPRPTWWLKFMQDSNFTNLLYCRWEELENTLLDPNNLYAFIDSIAYAMNESQQRNFRQWPVIGAYIYPNPQNQNGATYNSEVADVKSWIGSRLGWMDWAITGNCSVLTTTDEPRSSFKVSFYPNPMEQTSTFSIELSSKAIVNISVMDMMGKEVTRVLEDKRPAGESKITFTRNDIPAGIYIYRVEVNNEVLTGKIIMQ